MQPSFCIRLYFLSDWLHIGHATISNATVLFKTYSNKKIIQIKFTETFFLGLVRWLHIGHATTSNATAFLTVTLIRKLFQ